MFRIVHEVVSGMPRKEVLLRRAAKLTSAAALLGGIGGTLYGVHRAKNHPEDGSPKSSRILADAAEGAMLGAGVSAGMSALSVMLGPFLLGSIIFVATQPKRAVGVVGLTLMASAMWSQNKRMQHLEDRMNAQTEVYDDAQDKLDELRDDLDDNLLRGSRPVRK